MMMSELNEFRMAYTFGLKDINDVIRSKYNLKLRVNTARPYKLFPIDHKNLLTLNHQLQSLWSLILSFAVTIMNATKLIFPTSLHVSVQKITKHYY